MKNWKKSKTDIVKKRDICFFLFSLSFLFLTWRHICFLSLFSLRSLLRYIPTSIGPGITNSWEDTMLGYSRYNHDPQIGKSRKSGKSRKIIYPSRWIKSFSSSWTGNQGNRGNLENLENLANLANLLNFLDFLDLPISGSWLLLFY